MKAAALLLTLAACPAGAQTAVDPATIVPSPRVIELLRTIPTADATAEYADRLFARTGTPTGFDAKTLPGILAVRLAEQRADLAAISLAMDLNWDGAITRAEMNAVFAPKVDEPQAFTEALFATMDADSDGLITVSEIRFHTAINVPDSDLAILRDMVDWDLDGDGLVGRSDVATTLRALHPLAREATE